jgi:hypothetical protein
MQRISDCACAKGLCHMRNVLKKSQVDETASAVEARFNHVIRTVNMMSLQNILETVGFTTFKLRHVGRYACWHRLHLPRSNRDKLYRYDMVIPAFDTEQFDYLTVKSKWLPVVKAILGDDCDCLYKGVMLSLPGSFPQPWHQDGPHLSQAKHLKAHCLVVFLPLVDLTIANGPTEFVPTTHKLGNYEAPENPVAVCAPSGDAVFMDYRTRHRGLGNNSTEPRPLLYITYAKRGWTDRANFSIKRYRNLPELVMQTGSKSRGLICK